MKQHFYVFESTPGEFHFGEKLPAAKLKRDYLSPALDEFGNPLTPAERVRLGVWFPQEYEAALERGRAATVTAQAIGVGA